MENYSLPPKNAKPNGILASTSHYFNPKSTKRPLVAGESRARNEDNRRVATENSHTIEALPPSSSSTHPYKDTHKATKRQKRDAKVVPVSTQEKQKPAPQNGKRGPGRPRKVQAITESISRVLESAAALEKSENAIAFRCFDPLEHLTGAERVGIIGLPGMGKSTTVKSLLYELQSTFATLLVVSGFETDNNFYASCVPKLFIQNSVAPKTLKLLINRQRLVMNSKNKNTHTLLILDDVMDNPKALDNPAVNLLYKQGRHVNVSVWLIQQYPMDVKPYVRTTTSAVFLFHNGNTESRRKLYENYGSGVFRDFQEFDRVFAYITSSQKHTAMVILPNSGSSTLGMSGAVFWYRARTNIPKFQAGHPAIWRYANERTDESKTRDMTLLSTTECGD